MDIPLHFNDALIVLGSGYRQPKTMDVYEAA